MKTKDGGAGMCVCVCVCVCVCACAQAPLACRDVNARTLSLRTREHARANTETGAWTDTVDTHTLSPVTHTQ